MFGFLGKTGYTSLTQCVMLEKRCTYEPLALGSLDSLSGGSLSPAATNSSSAISLSTTGAIGAAAVAEYFPLVDEPVALSDGFVPTFLIGCFLPWRICQSMIDLASLSES